MEKLLAVPLLKPFVVMMMMMKLKAKTLNVDAKWGDAQKYIEQWNDGPMIIWG